MAADSQREKSLFDAARELTDPATRRAFLDAACGNDRALRARVERLLTTAEQADAFLAGCAPALEAAAAEIDPFQISPPHDVAQSTHEKLGSRIGPYKLLQNIGEGGSGIVYMAEQERPVRRRVALKIIKLGMDTKTVIARFEAERQALALMDHPNIARVLDAGATEAGRPYFVMELVYGSKITDYCDQNQLAVSERLKIFIQVCQGIQHAHQKGIIHRDIKPSNILVTMLDGVPVPKVIDFGIAKATEQRLTDKTLFTSYAQLMGTPAYMSPEQMEWSGLNLDTRSDIYGLGVLLYELLTGRTPFDTAELLKGGADEMRRTLREREPFSPSAKLRTFSSEELTKMAQRRQVDPRRFVSHLRGDLDRIVMKCLEKNRNRRYETAYGLAMDIQRHLNNEPVLARAPSRWYQFQRLVRRNRIVFASAAAVAAALIAGFGTSTWLFVRASRLLLESENRERMTRSAFLISRGKFQEADQLVSKVTELEPTLEVARVLRALGEWHVSSNKLDLAALRFGQLLQTDERDQSRSIYQSRWISLDLQMAGPLLIVQGDTQTYKRLRQPAIARLAHAFDELDADRTLKTSLLLPADGETMKSLEPFARLATGSFEKDLKDPGYASYLAIWRCVSLALMSYRQGDMAAAIDWCQKSLESRYDKVFPRLAASHIIKAMACYHLGIVNEARSELAQGKKMIDQYFAGGLRLGNNTEGFWYDWLNARVLLREAEALIEETRSVEK